MALEEWIERIEIARSRIESQLSSPAILNVSTAKLEDGGAALARILAYSFRQAGHATVLLECEGDSRDHADAESISKLIRPGVKGAPDLLQLDVNTPRSASDTQELYLRLRARYGIVISSQCLSSKGGKQMSLASHADAVVLGVRNGRAAGESDRQLSEALGAARTPVIGVILVSKIMVKAADAHEWTQAPFFSLSDDASLLRKTFEAKAG